MGENSERKVVTHETLDSELGENSERKVVTRETSDSDDDPEYATVMEG